jgi:membrane protein DedA with SNARE-associated domain
VSLLELFQRYGYWLVLAGTLVEGETILIMAGFAAHRGHLKLPWVMLIAFIGSFTGDQTMFFLGRYFGASVLRRFPKLGKTVDRVRGMLERRGAWLMLGFRFVYGLRNTTPFVIGMSALPARRFSPLNAAGAVLWAIVISELGFVFGEAVEVVLHKTRRFEEHALVGLLLAGALIFVVRHLLGLRKNTPRDSSA